MRLDPARAESPVELIPIRLGRRGIFPKEREIKGRCCKAESPKLVEGSLQVLK